MYRFLTAVLLALLLAACGGPSASNPSAPAVENAAQGVYFSGYTHPSITAIVLPDGRFYAPLANSSWSLAGLAIGQGTATSGVFTGSYRYFGGLGAHAGTVNASFLPGSSFNGTLSGNGSSIPINGVSLGSDVYNPAVPASASAISGHFVASILGSSCGVNVTITSGGTFTGTSDSGSACACNFSGTLEPDPKKNIYNATVNFPATQCPISNQSASGVAVLYKYPYPDGSGVDGFAILAVTNDSATLLMGFRDPNNLAPVP